MKNTGYKSSSSPLFKKLHKLLFFGFLFYLTSCELIERKYSLSFPKNLVFLKVDKNQNFSFIEINDFKDFQSYDIQGIEPFSDDSFVLVLSSSMDKGLVIKYQNRIYDYNTPQTFTPETSDLNTSTVASYNLRFKPFIENIPTDSIYTLLYPSYSSTEFMKLQYEDALIKKKQSYFLPNKVVGDSLYIRYAFSYKLPPNNLFELKKYTYSISYNSNSKVTGLIYKSMDHVSAHFPENPESEILLLDQYSPGIGYVNLISINESYIVTISAGNIYYGKPIEDGFIFKQIGSNLKYLGADDYAIYFTDHLYDIQKGYDRYYSDALTEYQSYSSSFTLNNQFYVVAVVGSAIQITTIDPITLNSKLKASFSLPSGTYANIKGPFIKGVTLNDGSTHFLLAEY